MHICDLDDMVIVFVPFVGFCYTIAYDIQCQLILHV